MADQELIALPPESWIERPVQSVGGHRFLRYVVRTHLIEPGEALDATLLPYLQGAVGSSDIVLISEKIVAISEGRVIPLESVHVSAPARFLAKRVGQLGYGRGLSRPETMQMAVAEAGWWRISLAAAAGAWDRLSGHSGDFYRVAGRRVAAIDGPGPETIAPYDQSIILAPLESQRLVRTLSRRLHGATVVVVDVNDVGSEILALHGHSDPMWVRHLTGDNLMGQGSQRTPVAVLRPIPGSRRTLPWSLEPSTEVTASSLALWSGLGQMDSPAFLLTGI